MAPACQDGCLRVSPHVGGPRRNFRISPMPLSAVAALGPELLALGGHDNDARPVLFPSAHDVQRDALKKGQCIKYEYNYKLINY